ncbi:MAG: Fe-S cluster assembly protein SufD [Verrucomicrobiota bacterium]|nr:Fe-S cluster assembly protein SufD [Verrucomicrobiota bacterium]
MNPSIENIFLGANHQIAQFIEEHEKFENSQDNSTPKWLKSLRSSGIAHFSELGFPTVKHEEWRYTNTAPVADMPFKPQTAKAQSNLRGEDFARYSLTAMGAHEIVFIDGQYSPRLSKPGHLPTGAIVCSFAEALREHSSLLEKYVGKSVAAADNGFVALNTAFIQDGIVIHIPRNLHVENPIHLLFITTTETGTAIQPRNLFVAESGSDATIVESHICCGCNMPTLKNSVTEVFVESNARLEHIKLQDECMESYHIATIQAELASDSRFMNHSVAIGAKLSRHNIHLHLNGKNIDALLFGIYAMENDQLCDHHTLVDHRKPHCGSHEYYHGILAGKSRGVFNGKIFVRQEAQKTDAKQTNRAILLGRDATVNTKPQLEIYADDVKCTHGATVGEMNEEAIQYLRCRGIAEQKARVMLTQAFAQEILDRIENEPLRAHASKLVEGKLTGMI